MDISTLHIIRRQYLDIEMNGTESEGLVLQRNLPNLCQHWLTPAIEQTLERCATPDQHLYIERLEILAGTFSTDQLESSLAESVTQVLEKFLLELTQLSESSSTIIPSNLQSKTEKATTFGNVSLKTKQQSINEAFVYFLENGYLPWSFRLPNSNNLEQEVLNSWQEASKSESKFHSIKNTILHVLTSTIARKRLVHQFSPMFMETLLSWFSTESKIVLDKILQVLHRSDIQIVEKKYFEQQLWETVFATVTKGDVLPTAESLINKAWCSLPVATQHIALATLLDSHWPNTTDNNPIQNNEPTPLGGKTLASINEQAGLKEGIYIDCAGLVLLHPFLPQFFQTLNVTLEDKLLQPSRALCLLHFLVTGQLVAPEYELVLPKILCNVPLETPIKSDMELTSIEQDEATALIESIIRHWKALRNTSIDGLRETFLIRPGKISLRDDGDRLLQVKSNTYDILLSHLPWSISMIKLPWMEKMLWVEWV